MDIYGPKGIEDFMAANLKVLNFGLTFPVRIMMIQEGVILDDESYAKLPFRQTYAFAFSGCRTCQSCPFLRKQYESNRGSPDRQ